MESARKRRVTELDAFRGLAALGVMLAHFNAYYAVTAGPDLPWTSAIAHAMQGSVLFANTCVRLFFVISGFVISYSLLRSNTAVDFIVSRASRLFPAYWVAVVISALTLTYALNTPIEGGLTNVFWNLTMCQWWVHKPYLDPVYWTLTIESVFYLWALIVWRLGLFPRVDLVAIPWLLAGVYQGVALRNGLPHLDGFWQRSLILDFMPLFYIGILYFRLYAGQIAAGPRFYALIAAALLARYFSAYSGMNLNALLIDTAIATAFGLMVSGRLTLLANPVLLWLGAVSYSLYITHHFVGKAILIRLHALGAPEPLIYLVPIAACLVLATAVTYLVEQPALGLIRSLYKRLRPPPAPIPHPGASNKPASKAA
ncbi:acyltransferase family protein [Mucisphaera calidilacus]|uniref:Acyltransferase family protein n=1 Tax=Mucisphaera calidilacus TaxID=2527982 RepID=A0A518BYW1_9BACT|nr:acyltransferase [Mucisphaera calidilacus]QDU72160.1 Acyltransferase family protein [Mucisphaera calidilacus]